MIRMGLEKVYSLLRNIKLEEFALQDLTASDSGG